MAEQPDKTAPTGRRPPTAGALLHTDEGKDATLPPQPGHGGDEPREGRTRSPSPAGGGGRLHFGRRAAGSGGTGGESSSPPRLCPPPTPRPAACPGAAAQRRDPRSEEPPSLDPPPPCRARPAPPRCCCCWGCPGSCRRRVAPGGPATSPPGARWTPGRCPPGLTRRSLASSSTGACSRCPASAASGSGELPGPGPRPAGHSGLPGQARPRPAGLPGGGAPQPPRVPAPQGAAAVRQLGGSHRNSCCGWVVPAI